MTGRAIVRPPGSGPAGRRDEAEARGDVALVVGERDRARTSPRRAASAPDGASGRTSAATSAATALAAVADLDDERPTRLERADRRREVVRTAGEPDVAEAVDVDDPGLEPAVVAVGGPAAAAGRGRRSRSPAPTSSNGVAHREMGADRAEDVAAVERRRRDATARGRGSRGSGPRRSRRARSAAGDEQAVVRADEHGRRARCGSRSGAAPCRRPGPRHRRRTPTRKYGSAHQSRNAPSRIAYFRTRGRCRRSGRPGRSTSITPRQIGRRTVRPEVGQEADERAGHAPRW